MVLEKDTAVLLLAWYDFPVSSAILCIEENNEAFSSSLKKRGLAADSATIRTSARASFVDANLDKYDYIVAAGGFLTS